MDERRLILEPFARPLERPFRSAAGEWSAREGLVVRLGDGEGAGAGVGEAAPLPGLSPDRLEEVRAALAAVSVEPLGDGDEERVLSWVGRQVARLPEALPAARFGLETALLDHAGRRLGRPVWELLGAPRRPAVPLAAVCEPFDDDVAHARARGFRTIKLKLGRAAFAAEVDAVWRLTRDRRVQWRFDVNRAWAVGADELERRVRVLTALGPELIEEPGPLSRDAAVRLAAPLALDESLVGMPGEERQAWLDSGALRAVVLKPTLLGGVLPCLALARRAAARGVMAIASHALEGPVGRRAVAALALAIEAPHAHGVGGDAPILSPWDEPGLGLTP